MKRVFILVALFSLMMAGCRVFKKDCDCPRFNNRKARMSQTAPEDYATIRHSGYNRGKDEE